MRSLTTLLPQVMPMTMLGMIAGAATRHPTLGIGGHTSQCMRKSTGTTTCHWPGAIPTPMTIDTPLPALAITLAAMVAILVLMAAVATLLMAAAIPVLAALVTLAIPFPLAAATHPLILGTQCLQMLGPPIEPLHRQVLSQTLKVL